jgi:hypothetical protein
MIGNTLTSLELAVLQLVHLQEPIEPEALDPRHARVASKLRRRKLLKFRRVQRLGLNTRMLELTRKGNAIIAESMCGA